MEGSRDHYDVLIVKEDLYDHEAYFMVGGAAHELAAVISTYRFTSLEPLLQSEVLKTATMHEVGHIFGLLPESRTNNVEYLLGKHCLNVCIMRQGPRVPYDWIRMTQERRAATNPFCPQCSRDLKLFFLR